MEQALFTDLVVVELASVLAGPSVGMFFAEMGARVIKIENPRKGGDVTRGWKLANEDPEEDRSAYFSSLNWGKESLCLDLRQTGAKSILLDLLAGTDILLSNFVPGQAERLGLGAESLCQRFPRLILGEINGYGKGASRPAYDAIIQAECGIMYLNGEGENIYKMPVAFMDILAAHQLKEGLLMALIERGRTGQGKRVSVSLLQAGMAALVNQATNWLMAGKVPRAIGSAHPNIAPYGTHYQCRDGNLIVLAVGNDQQFAALCQILGEAVPINFAHNSLRLQNRQELEQWLGLRFQAWDRDTLLQQLLAQNVPAGAINTMPQVMELPQAQQMLLQSDNQRGLRSYVGEHPPLDLSPPPHLGEHTNRILSELGYDASALL